MDRAILVRFRSLSLRARVLLTGCGGACRRSLKIIEQNREYIIARWHQGTNFVEGNPMNQVFLCAQQAKVDGYRRMIDITLEDGDVYRCSLADSSERLRLAHPSLVEEWEWIGPQAGIHWAAVDEDLSIEYLVNKGHLVGNQEMVRTKSPLLVPAS